MAASGSVMKLVPGVTVRDAEGERTTFRGEPIRMQHMVVTFTLRSDVRWSDGERLRADDSVYGFEVAANAATPTDKYLVERTADYRAVDERQVAWEGVPGYIDRHYFLNLWHPLPRHAWAELSAAELVTAEVSSRYPLGWGAFAIREWTPDALTLVRNPYYYRAPEGLPHLDEVVFRFVPDAESLGRHTASGTCDVITHEATAAIDLDRLTTSPAVATIATQDRSWELLAFGISPAAEYDRPDFFEDVRVRQAIAQCLDRQAIADAAAIASERLLHSFVPPDHPAYAGDALTTWPYDVEAGKLLLAEAGWYDEDGDGVRESHGIPGIVDGTPFEVTYKTTDDPLRLRTSALVRDQLIVCGLEVIHQTLPNGVLYAPGPDGELFGRKFDLAQFAWQATAEPLCDAFLSSQIPDEGNWNKPNVVGFIDGAYDRACQEALGTLPGNPDYTSRQVEPQRIFSERLPVLPLFQHHKTTLARASVTGISPNVSQWSELWNLEEIDRKR
jgi:peptide/nickel transport system substrate-binding protein